MTRNETSAVDCVVHRNQETVDFSEILALEYIHPGHVEEGCFVAHTSATAMSSHQLPVYVVGFIDR